MEAFLVIGAYFLTSKYLKCEQRDIIVGDAFIHRIKRLYPVYVLLIVVAVAFKAVTNHQINTDSLWYLFSLQNFRCLFDGNWNSLDGLIGHFWYIGLDVWLFLLWVILMRLVPKKHLRKAFLVSLSVGLLWRTLFIVFKPDSPSFAYVILIGQLDCWSIGGLVALNINEKGNNKPLRWIEKTIGLVGILLLICYNALQHDCSIGEGYLLFRSANGYMSNPLTGNIHVFIALLSAGVLRHCLDTSKRHPILSANTFVALGGISYELYCFHYPIRALTQIFIHNEIIMVFVALLVTLLVSWLWCRLATPVIKKIIK